MPTLLSLMEIETGVQYDGRNLLPLLEGQPGEGGAGILYYRMHLGAQAWVAHA